MVFSIPIIAILAGHSRKMAELKLRLKQEGKQTAGSNLAQLTQQVTELRDITTKYDLSFDQALQRIEARTAHLEERVTALERGGVVTEQTSR